MLQGKMAPLLPMGAPPPPPFPRHGECSDYPQLSPLPKDIRFSFELTLCTSSSALHLPFSGGETLYLLHMTTVCFMKGLIRTFPLVVKPTPQWELNFVLSILTGKPFEPMATYAMTNLSMKVVFL